jgi:hypothetical protein
MSFDSRLSLKDKKIIIVDGDCEMNGLTVRMQKEQEEMNLCVCMCVSEGLSLFLLSFSHTARQCQKF